MIKWIRTSRLSTENSVSLRPLGLIRMKWGVPRFGNVTGILKPGLIRLSETGPVHGVMYLQDHGGTYDSGSATHHLVPLSAC